MCIRLALVSGLLAATPQGAFGLASAQMEFKFGIQFTTLPNGVVTQMISGNVVRSMEGFGLHEELSDGEVVIAPNWYTQQIAANALTDSPPTSVSHAETRGPRGLVSRVTNDSDSPAEVRYSVGGWAFGWASVSKQGELATVRFAFTMYRQSLLSDGAGSAPFPLISLSGSGAAPLQGDIITVSHLGKVSFTSRLAPHEVVEYFVDVSEVDALAFSPAEVPDPSSTGVMLVGAAAWTIRRRRRGQ